MPFNADFSKVDRLRAEAKKLRAAARRAEAKGDWVRAGELRDQADGCRWEAQYAAEHSGR